MRTVTEHGYTTYPRRFHGYKWFKPVLVGLFFSVLYVFMGAFLLDLIVQAIFGTTVSNSGYDGMMAWTSFQPQGPFIMACRQPL